MVSNTSVRTDGTDGTERDGTVKTHDPQLRRACDSVRSSLAALGHPSALDLTDQQLVDGALALAEVVARTGITVAEFSEGVNCGAMDDLRVGVRRGGGVASVPERDPTA